MKSHDEKIYCKLNGIKDFIKGKASGICIAGIFCFITSKIPMFFKGLGLNRILFDLVSDSTIILSIIVYPTLFMLNKITLYYRNKIILEGPIPKFNKLIIDNTSDVIKMVKGAYSWGDDLTKCWCPIILDGWNTEDVLLEKYDIEKFDIAPLNKEKIFIKDFFASFDEYLKDDKSINIINSKDNMGRVMLTSYRCNYNTNSPKLKLSFMNTEYLVNSYLWDKWRDDKVDISLKKKMILNHFDLGEEILPNSFCLHLIIETYDNKIVLTYASKDKRNDQPTKIAATLGEQLEESDLINYETNDIRKDFVEHWIRRALLEEFGFDDITFNEIYDPNLNKVLSVNFESDIYNFSLLAVTKIKYNYDQLLEYIDKTHQNIEFAGFDYIKLSDIPEKLINYKKYNFHSSTPIRLLMLYMHKYGNARTIEDLNRAKESK